MGLSGSGSFGGLPMGKRRLVEKRAWKVRDGRKERGYTVSILSPHHARHITPCLIDHPSRKPGAAAVLRGGEGVQGESDGGVPRVLAQGQVGGWGWVGWG